MDINDRYHKLDAAVYPWFDAQWARVIKLYRQERLPHALLLNGPQGIGKARFAEAVAGYVMCHQPQDQAPCGHCRSCVLLNSSGHPDLYFLKPDEPGKPIKVDQIRQLTEFMHNTAQQGGYRAVILDPAEAMNVSAANALLKTLEEPGRDTLLILITHQAGRVMPTIKSRCQRLDCHLPTTEQATQWLQAQLSLESAEAEQLLSVAHGAPLAALHFREAGHQSLRAELMTVLRDVLRQHKTPLEGAEQLHKQDLILLLGWFQGVLADIARYGFLEAQAPVRNRDMQKMIQGVAKYTTTDKILLLAEKVQEELVGLQRRQNPNKQLLLEHILIEWSALVRS